MRREPGRADPAIDAAKQRIERAEQRARFAIAERVAMTAHERERLGGDGAQRAGQRRRHCGRRREVARERLRGRVRGGLRERHALVGGRRREHDLEPALDEPVAARQLVGDLEARRRPLARLPELVEQRVDRAAAARLGGKAGEPRRDRTRSATTSPSARATSPLFAAAGTKSASARAMRRASVGAPIAIRSPSAVFDHLDRCARHHEAGTRERDLIVAAGLGELDAPQFLERAAMLAGGDAARAPPRAARPRRVP